MINDLFDFLRTSLLKWLGKPDDEEGAEVNFVDINGEQPAFDAKINILLISLEEDRILRPADPYSVINESGAQERVKPPLILNLNILFATKPIKGKKSDGYNYLEAMRYLSQVLQFFQANPVLTSDRYSKFPEGIDKVIMELIPLTYAQQNEIWSSLKVAHLPAVCYRAKMIVIQEEVVAGDRDIEEPQPRLETI